MAKGIEITPNPIIERLKGKGKVSRLDGYVSRGTSGTIEVYADLSLEICAEFDEQDILHIEPGQKSTDSCSIFVRSEAEVMVRQQTTAAKLGEAESGGCECSEPDEPQEYLAAMIDDAGTGAKPLTCDQRLARCKTKCKNKGAFRQGCLDSCAASHRLCKSLGGGFGGGGIVIF